MERCRSGNELHKSLLRGQGAFATENLACKTLNSTFGHPAFHILSLLTQLGVRLGHRELRPLHLHGSFGLGLDAADRLWLNIRSMGEGRTQHGRTLTLFGLLR